MNTPNGRESTRDASWEFLPTEVTLLLLAAGGEATSPEFQRVARRPLDWTRLTRLAFEAHATPVVWRQLDATPGLEFPRESWELQSLGVLNEFRLRHIGEILADVVNRLAKAGIEVMLLKGAALLAGAAAKPLERTMGDIDLLVIKGSPEQAWRLCREAGWELAFDEELYVEHHHFPPLTDPFGIQLALELHRSLFPPGNRLRVDEAAFVARGRRVQLDGTTVLVPSLEDLLLHACLHFAWSHALEVGAWRTFADAHIIVADPRFSWDRFVELVKATNGASYCYWPLRLAEEATRLQVPPSVLDQMRPRRPAWLLTALERHFFAHIYDKRSMALPVRLNRLLWRLATRPGNGEGPVTAPWALGTMKGPEPVPVMKPRRTLATRSRDLKAAVQYLIALLRPPARTS